MKKLIIILCFFSMATQAQEQDSITRKLKWTNLVQVGQVFDGNEGVTGRLTASWISGVQINKITTGLELGFSDYDIFKLGSIALHGKYRLLKRGLSPYAYGLAGYGLPLYFRSDSQIDATSSKGGILFGAGIGADFPLGKVTLLIQLGYKFQKTTYDEPNYYYYDISRLANSTFDLFAPYSGEDYNYTTRKMNRVEFKVGVQF